MAIKEFKLPDIGGLLDCTVIAWGAMVGVVEKPMITIRAMRLVRVVIEGLLFGRSR